MGVGWVGPVLGSGFVERGLTRVRLSLEGEEDVVVEGEAGSDDALAFSTPQLPPGAWAVAVSINGDAGEFVDCPTPFTAL